MIDVQLSTYWNVETLYDVFNAVSAMMAGSGYSGLVKMVFLFAVTIGMFGYMNGRHMEMASWFFQALIFVSMLNLPIARVTITDKTNMQPPMVVSNVPFAMAEVAEVTNLTFGFITEEYETAFGLPSNLGLEQGDVGFGHKILKMVNQAEIEDPQLRSDLMQYFKECTIYDVKDGQISAQDIVTGTDVWNTIFSNTSPARFVTYNTLSPAPVTDTCSNAAIVLKGRVTAAVTAAQNYYGKQAFPLASSSALASSMFVNVIGTSNDWILQSSQSASDALKQSMFNNMWKQAGTSLPAMLNDPAQVAEVSALAGEAQAAAQANGGNSVLSLLGQETLPHVRNWIEAILYSMFPVIVILMVVSSTEGAKKVFAGYIMSLGWIGLWPVLFAVINHMSLSYLKHKSAALSLSGGVPFQLSDVYNSTLVDEQAMIGYMVVLVPFIAAGIIKMSSGGIMSLADKAITGFTQAGAAAGAAWSTGNVSMGQSSVDNHTANTTTMNKMDTSIGMQGGGATIGLASGGTARMAANGTAAIDAMQNHFVEKLDLAHRSGSDRSSELHHTEIAGTGTNVSRRDHDGASLSRTHGKHQHRGTSASTSTDATTYHQGSTEGHTSTGESTQNGYTSTDSFNGSVAQIDSGRGNLGIGSGGGGGSSAGQPSRAGVGEGESADEIKRITSSMKQTGASEKDIEKAVAAYRESRGGAAPSRGGLLSAGLGVDTQRVYNMSDNKGKQHSEQHNHDRSANRGASFSDGGSLTVTGSKGEDSGTDSSYDTSATRSTGTENSTTRDAQHRVDDGVGQRNSISDTFSLQENRDLLSDTAFMQQVATRNGMSAMRFYNQSQDEILRMTSDYIAEKGISNSAKNLSGQGLSGQQLTQGQGLSKLATGEGGQVKANIGRIDASNQSNTGAGSVAPVTPDITLPNLAGEAKGEVNAALDPKDKTSIPATTGGFDENLRAWSGEGRELGQGRVTLNGEAEHVEWLDTKDGFLKAWDSIKGGDGQADGHAVTPAERLQVVPEIPKHPEEH